MSKLAAEVSEFRGFIPNQFRNHTHFIVLLQMNRDLWSVDERVFVPRVSVHINKRYDFFRLSIFWENQIVSHLFNGTNSWM